MLTSHFEQLADRLRKAQRITVLTGAGVSAASGVPTFRGDGGLWKNYKAEDLATPEAFNRDPRLVWEWYDWRRRLISTCKPNAAHVTLAGLNGRPGFTLITQNVDGLHERAGSQRDRPLSWLDLAAAMCRWLLRSLGRSDGAAPGIARQMPSVRCVGPAGGRVVRRVDR